MPQLRQNIVTGEWVVIAPERAKRPSDFVQDKNRVRHEAEENDAFRVGGEAWQTRYKEMDTSNIYVIPNKYPAFIDTPSHVSPRSHRVEDDFYRVRPSVGGHDVVVVKNPKDDLYHFPDSTWYELLSAFKKRYEYYVHDRESSYQMPIYNHGSAAAASIEHPHAQIFASTIIPNSIVRELNHSELYFEHHGKSVFSEMLKHEKAEKIRVIGENAGFLAFTFFAARFPFEIWILPKEHRSHYKDMKAEELSLLAAMCKQVFKKLGDAVNEPPVNFFIHSAPSGEAELPHYCWHMEIGPRLSNYGGFELGAGTVIDVVSPEKAAQYLRGEAVD